MNAKTMHTPGPWVVCQERLNEVLFKDGEGVLPLICTVETDNADVEQWKADARLISAAPEMLGEIMRLHREGGLGLGVHQRLRTLITKATGAAS